MTVSIDNKQLHQALRHFNPTTESVVTWLRNSTISPQIASLDDEVITHAVHDLFVERLQGLSRFLQGKGIIDASADEDLMRLVNTASKANIADTALRMHSVLIRHIHFEKLPLMRTSEMSFDRELVSQFPPCLFGFLHGLTSTAFLHEIQSQVSEERSIQIKNQLNALKILPIPAVRCYTLVKQASETAWRQLGLVHYNSEGGCLELSQQSAFVQLLVNCLIKDHAALQVILDDSSCHKTVQTSQLVQLMAERLFQQQRDILACRLGFMVYDKSLQHSQYEKALDELIQNQGVGFVIALIHLIVHPQFLNQCVEHVLPELNKLDQQQFKKHLYQLLSPLPGSPSHPELLARATLNWMKNNNDTHLQLLHDFLHSVRSPVAQDVKNIMGKQQIRDQQAANAVLPK